MTHVLIVDDEAGMRDFLRILLEKEGFAVTAASDGSEALERAAASPVDLVISDIKMPNVDGVGLLAGLRKIDRDLPVIMITAYASSESAIHAMRLGAYDYITKPFKVEEIKLVIGRALEARRLKAEAPAAPREAAERTGLQGIIGRSPKMIELYKLISRVAAVESTVLVTGESGTGKELVARTIHYNSPRAGKPFLAINCGAIPEPLLESELFGHVKGAFTGAVVHKAGLFEVAHGGTVFLDEVAEMSPSLQVKLLRVLQDGIFRRVGGTEDIGVDVRVVAATNKDLEELIGRGLFREDLYYRLNVITVAIPPLRERREDIPLLAENFLTQFGARAGRGILAVSPEAMALLTAYPWPGNVRELENVLERAVALAPTDVVTPEILPETLVRRREAATDLAAGPAALLALPPEGMDLEEVIAQIERSLIQEALDRAGGIQTRAAQLLGINFRSFRYRLKKYGLEGRGRGRDEGGEAADDG